MGDISFVLQTAIAYLFDPMHLIFIAGGTIFGLIFGCLPGLSATMGVALMIPMTYSMNPALALGVMIGVYVGGIAGGAISATLINIPGTPSGKAVHRIWFSGVCCAGILWIGGYCRCIR